MNSGVLAAAGTLAAAVLVAQTPAAGRLTRLQGGRPARSGDGGGAGGRGPTPGGSGPTVPVESPTADLRSRAVAVGERPAATAAVAAVLAMAGLPVGPTAAALVGVVGWLGLRAYARGFRRREAAGQLDVAARSISALAAELRGGQPPLQALAAVATTTSGPVGQRLRAVVQVCRLGADPPAALEMHAGEVPGLRRLAACWRLAGRSGAGLADVIDLLAEELRDRARRDQRLAVALAAPTATVRLLAGLPVLGLVLGISLGAHPVHFLLQTAPGAAVVTVAALLEGLGLFATHRLVERVRSR